jgi:hypothetical protein
MVPRLMTFLLQHLAHDGATAQPDGLEVDGDGLIEGFFGEVVKFHGAVAGLPRYAGIVDQAVMVLADFCRGGWTGAEPDVADESCLVRG